MYPLPLQCRRARCGCALRSPHYRFAATGEELTAQTVRRFRTAAEVDRSLLVAGFVTEHRYGGRDRRPFTGHDDELVMVARAVV